MPSDRSPDGQIRRGSHLRGVIAHSRPESPTGRRACPPGPSPVPQGPGHVDRELGEEQAHGRPRTRTIWVARCWLRRQTSSQGSSDRQTTSKGSGGANGFPPLAAVGTGRPGRTVPGTGRRPAATRPGTAGSWYCMPPATGRHAPRWGRGRDATVSHRRPTSAPHRADPQPPVGSAEPAASGRGIPTGDRPAGAGHAGVRRTDGPAGLRAGAGPSGPGVLGDQWDVDRVVTRTLRSPLAGTVRLPSRLLADSSPWLRRQVGRAVYRGYDLVHRFDLRLPPAPYPEVLTIHDVVAWRFADEARPPTDAAATARRAAAVVCPSKFSAGEVSAQLGVTTAVAIPNGVDAGVLRRLRPRHRRARRSGDPPAVRAPCRGVQRPEEPGRPGRGLAAGPRPPGPAPCWS